VESCGFRGMAQVLFQLHHANMYTSLKKPRLGDRVRLTGFLGVFEVVRVRPDGSLVDLKHLDLHQTDYIEQEVSSHDLIYVRGPQPSPALGRPAPTPAVTPAQMAGSRTASTSRPANTQAAGKQAPHRSTTVPGYASRAAQQLAPVTSAQTSQTQRRKSS
jgi:hypothetical protein